MRYRVILLVGLAVLIALPGPAITAQTSDPLAGCTPLLFDYEPVTGTLPHPAPADSPLPPVREAWRDPTFGACVIRVSNSDIDFGTHQGGIKQEYSRVQAFNQDGSLFLAQNTVGEWFLYDARTLHAIQYVMLDNSSITEPRWDPQNPLRFTFMPLNLELHAIDLYLHTTKGYFYPDANRVHNFADDLLPDWNARYLWRRWEGSPSLDGRYDAFMVEDADFITRGLITYDVQADTVIGRYSVPHGDLNEPDSVSMSPLGGYVLAQFEACEAGTMGTYEEPCGAMIYTRDLTAGRGIVRIIGHSDLALTRDRREVLVYQEIDRDTISMADLETGKITDLLDLDFSQGEFGLHFSGQAAHEPGWVLVSVYEAPDVNNPLWMVGTIFAVELTSHPRVIQLAHHHSLRPETEEGYFAEPQATVNRDFTRILFTSNWGNTQGAVETYMIVLPDAWLDHLPCCSWGGG